MVTSLLRTYKRPDKIALHIKIILLPLNFLTYLCIKFFSCSNFIHQFCAKHNLTFFFSIKKCLFPNRPKIKMWLDFKEDTQQSGGNWSINCILEIFYFLTYHIRFHNLFLLCTFIFFFRILSIRCCLFACFSIISVPM